MYKITTNKGIFKSKFNIEKDTVFILPTEFVLKGVIYEHEWARSHQRIFDRFNLKYKIEKIDGRKKELKSIKHFTWRILFN